MTQTPNVGLKKIDGSENWRNIFDYHNYSMDQADEAIAAARGGLTYVENGDTIAANADYTEGKFVCWKGEIYRILSTINATVTSANWTTYLTKMDGIGGALSQINGDLATLNSKIVSKFQYIGIVIGEDSNFTRQQVIDRNPTDMGNIYGYICCEGYSVIIGFVHKTQEYGGQLRLSYLTGLQYRKYYNGTWSEWA